MFNRFVVQSGIQKFNQTKAKLQKDQRWITKYRNQVRPGLIRKHQKRLQGFAKKMQSDPVILPQQQHQKYERKFNFNQSQRKFNTQSSITEKQGIKTHRTKISQQSQYKKLERNNTQTYINPKSTFRIRQKTKQINPPMKYNNKAPKHNPLSKKQKQSKTLHLSRDSFTDNDLPSDNNISISQFDMMSMHNHYFQQRLQAERRKKEEELKALSRDRLYFKSLMGYEQRVGDVGLKNGFRDVLVKCKMLKPYKRRLKEESQRDLFAEIMKYEEKQ